MEPRTRVDFLAELLLIVVGSRAPDHRRSQSIFLAFRLGRARSLVCDDHTVTNHVQSAAARVTSQHHSWVIKAKGIFFPVESFPDMGESDLLHQNDQNTTYLDHDRGSDFSPVTTYMTQTRFCFQPEVKVQSIVHGTSGGDDVHVATHTHARAHTHRKPLTGHSNGKTSSCSNAEKINPWNCPRHFRGFSRAMSFLLAFVKRTSFTNHAQA